ncbi:hypothetical protein EDB19DRAFT_1833436 [Suillus lakei]|nr:hypothetical protein EDB19DRAFT_1833436 [Suillus lakei]
MADVMYTPAAHPESVSPTTPAEARLYAAGPSNPPLENHHPDEHYPPAPGSAHALPVQKSKRRDKESPVLAPSPIINPSLDFLVVIPLRPISDLSADGRVLWYDTQGYQNPGVRGGSCDQGNTTHITDEPKGDENRSDSTQLTSTLHILYLCLPCLDPASVIHATVQLDQSWLEAYETAKMTRPSHILSNLVIAPLSAQAGCKPELQQH